MNRTIQINSGSNVDQVRELPDVERLHAALRRYCLSLTGSVWDAEDLAQDTWAKALSTLLGPGHRNAEAYLLRIAKHAWIDQCRRTRLRKQKMPLQEQQKVAETDDDPFETVQAFEVLAGRLTPLQRAVYLLRDIFGYSNAEAARRLRTTEGAVKSSLHRARQALEAARSERTAGRTATGADDALRPLVFAMAAAYRRGDVERLVTLALQDAVPPVAAFAAIQQHIHHRRQRFSPPMARMAA